MKFRQDRKSGLFLPDNKPEYSPYLRLIEGHPLSQNATGFWLFNEGGGNIAIDISESDNHGTLNGATWTVGQFDSALSFNGTSNYVDYGGKVVGSGSFTISLWIKQNAIKQYVISQDGNNAGDFLFDTQQGEPGWLRLFRWTGSGNGYQYWESTLAVGANTWNHIAVVYDGTQATLYLNGVSQSPTPTTGSYTQTSRNTTLGAWRQLGSYYNGLVDHNGIWNRAFTAAEIKQLISEPFCMVEELSPARHFVSTVTNTATFTIDAHIAERKTDTFTLDSIVRETKTDTFTIDAIVEETKTATFTADVIIQETKSATFTLDVIVEETKTDTFTLDVIVEETKTDTFTLDVIVEETKTDTFTLDVIVEETKTDTFTLDVIVEETKTDTFTLDVIVEETKTDTFTIDVYLAEHKTNAFTIDVIIRETKAATVTLDAHIVTLDTFTIDVMIEVAQIATFTIDAQITGDLRFLYEVISHSVSGTYTVTLSQTTGGPGISKSAWIPPGDRQWFLSLSYDGTNFDDEIEIAPRQAYRLSCVVRAVRVRIP